MSDQDATGAGGGTQFSAGRLLLMVVLVVAAGAIIFQYLKSQEPQATNEKTLAVMGLDKPTTNQLAAPFEDADGDLIADPPADPSAALDPDTLTFSFIAVSDAERDQEVWSDFIDHLAKETGKTVEYMPFEHTEDQLKALKAGELHVAVLNTGSVPIAVNASGFVPVCAAGNEEGPSSYKMKIIVPADSKLQTANDLSGETLTLTDPSSNSGCKAAIVVLRNDFNMEPERDYSIRFSYDHIASIQGVAKGEIDAAAVASDIVDRLVAQGEVESSAFRAIHESQPFPSAGMGYNHRLNPELAEKVKAAMLGFQISGSSVESEYASAGATAFVPVSYKDDWSLIRMIDDVMGYQHELQ